MTTSAPAASRRKAESPPSSAAPTEAVLTSSTAMAAPEKRKPPGRPKKADAMTEAERAFLLRRRKEAKRNSLPSPDEQALLAQYRAEKAKEEADDALALDELIAQATERKVKDVLADFAAIAHMAGMLIKAQKSGKRVDRDIFVRVCATYELICARNTFT